MPDNEDIKPHCKDKFENLEKTDDILFGNIDKIFARFDRVIEKITDLSDKIYKDNGLKSISTRISEAEWEREQIKKQLEDNPWLKVMKWTTVTLASGIVLGFLSLLFWVARDLIVG